VRPLRPGNQPARGDLMRQRLHSDACPLPVAEELASRLPAGTTRLVRVTAFSATVRISLSRR